MVKDGFDITEKKIRARQVDPDKFEKDSLRTIRLAPGVQAIVGRIEGEKNTTIQSILFDKDRYSESQAKEWLGRNQSKFSDALSMEEQKISLFSPTLEEHVVGHLPPLTETQIARLMEVAGPAEEEMSNQEVTSKFVKRI